MSPPTIPELDVPPRRVPLRFDVRWVLPATVAVIAFVIDLATPRGVMDGYLYVLAVLSCVWLREPRAPLIVAGLCYVLMALGLVLAPGGIGMVGVALINAVAAAGIAGVAAVVVWHHGRLAHAPAVEPAAPPAPAPGVAGVDGERGEWRDWLRQTVMRELGTLSWRLGGAARLAAGRPDGGELAQLKDVVDRLAREVADRSAQLTGPSAVADDGDGALSRMVEAFRAASGLAVSVRGLEQLHRLPPATSSLVGRVLLAALDNVTAHACAGRVWVECRSDAAGLELQIIDDGCGVPAQSQARLRSGALAALQRQAAEVGGHLILANVVPHGFKVLARLPLR